MLKKHVYKVQRVFDVVTPSLMDGFGCTRTNIVTQSQEEVHDN